MTTAATSTRNESKTKKEAIHAIRLWQLPDNFYKCSDEEQWLAIKLVTAVASPLQKPREPCRLVFLDECLAVSFFMVTLGFPFVLLGLWLLAIIFWYRKITNLVVIMAVVTTVLALHTIPKRDYRRSRLALTLIRYFTLEILIDFNDPLAAGVATAAVDSDDYQERLLPLVCLACPHGVFNYGAIVWCCISRWILGREQYTGAANALRYVPCLRYMDSLIWAINADRKSIKSALQQRGPGRTGGMLGMVPDGILGAFRCKHGVDELVIGKKRGLLRICAEEGASVYAGWFFGTTEMLTVVQDPWGIMENISRKLQAGMLGYYGRWFLPLPRRVAVTQIVSGYRCKKTLNPTAEQIEEIHNEVYGGLQRAYDEQKAYAGYPNSTLHIQ